MKPRLKQSLLDVKITISYMYEGEAKGGNAPTILDLQP
jgi:hypothetical protein